jgi:DNA adenine methylase
MKKPFRTYNGGKNGSGVYQSIINQIPPHEIFISGFAGNCGVLANKKRAVLANIAVDVDTSVTDAWNKIHGVITYNLPFLKTVEAFLYDNRGDAKEKLFIFLDPPYLLETRSGKRNLYKHEMTCTASHKKLLSAVKKLPFNVCLVHYPNKLYNDTLKNWRKVDIQGRTRNGMRIERLYMNYDTPTKLHDYFFFGCTYREREMYKRQKNNMVSKFNKMPDMVRNFIISELKEKNIL